MKSKLKLWVSVALSNAGLKLGVGEVDRLIARADREVLERLVKYDPNDPFVVKEFAKVTRYARRRGALQSAEEWRRKRGV